MAVQAPHEDTGRGREAFRAMGAWFGALQIRHPGIDTLSMGMTADLDAAIQAGSTMVRVGTGVFGARTYPAA